MSYAARLARYALTRSASLTTDLSLLLTDKNSQTFRFKNFYSPTSTQAPCGIKGFTRRPPSVPKHFQPIRNLQILPPPLDRGLCPDAPDVLAQVGFAWVGHDRSPGLKYCQLPHTPRVRRSSGLPSPPNTRHSSNVIWIIQVIYGTPAH